MILHYKNIINFWDLSAGNNYLKHQKTSLAYEKSCSQRPDFHGHPLRLHDRDRRPRTQRGSQRQTAQTSQPTRPLRQICSLTVQTTAKLSLNTTTHVWLTLIYFHYILAIAIFLSILGKHRNDYFQNKSLGNFRELYKRLFAE